MDLTPEVRAGYNTLFKDCQMRDSKRAEAMSLAWDIRENKPRYDTVGNHTGVPWFVIGAIHSLEASLSFSRHLHNGDPLTHRTVHVPKGRPVVGNPPFGWEDSAIDALRLDGMAAWKDWTVGGCLYRLEGFNGWGYRTHGVHSPYLWGGTNWQMPGKYVSDGVWDPSAATQQIGAAALLHILQFKVIISLKE